MKGNLIKSGVVNITQPQVDLLDRGGVDVADLILKTDGSDFLNTRIDLARDVTFGVKHVGFKLPVAHQNAALIGINAKLFIAGILQSHTDGDGPFFKRNAGDSDIEGPEGPRLIDVSCAGPRFRSFYRFVCRRWGLDLVALRTASRNH